MPHGPENSESASGDAQDDRATRTEIPVCRFEVLSGGGVEVIIEHQGQQYRLRVTRNGGLILKK